MPLVFSFFIFWAMTGYLFYSYVREQVPWLFLHAAVPLVFMSLALFEGLDIGSLWRGRRSRVWMGALAAATLVFALRMNHRENVVGPRSGRYVFGDSHWTVFEGPERLVADVRDYARRSGKGRELRIQVMEDGGYLAWIVRGYFIGDFDRILWGSENTLFEPDVVIATTGLSHRVGVEILPGVQGVQYRFFEATPVNFRNFRWASLMSFYWKPEEFRNGPSLAPFFAVGFFRPF
jgi:hypothetical protein